MAQSPRRPTGPVPGGTLERLARQSQLDFELDFFGPIVERLPGFLEAIRIHANNLSLKGRHGESLLVELRWAELRPGDPLAHYNLACSYARTSQPDRAIDSLRRAVQCGYRDFRHMTEDRDLNSLHGDPRFVEILEGNDAA